MGQWFVEGPKRPSVVVRLDSYLEDSSWLEERGKAALIGLQTKGQGRKRNVMKRMGMGLLNRKLSAS